MGYTLLGDSDVLERKITNWVSALYPIFLFVLPFSGATDGDASRYPGTSF
jgi:hypothetical protein